MTMYGFRVFTSVTSPLTKMFTKMFEMNLNELHVTLQPVADDSQNIIFKNLLNAHVTTFWAAGHAG